MTSRRTFRTWFTTSVVGVAVVGLLGACATAATPAGVQQFAGGPTVAFYGDSYTLGTGASHPAKRWSSIISAERGWNDGRGRIEDARP